MSLKGEEGNFRPLVAFGMFPLGLGLVPAIVGLENHSADVKTHTDLLIVGPAVRLP